MNLLNNKKNETMRKLFIIPILIFTINFSFSQEVENDTLKTEEITVVKPYKPTISKSSKIKSNPKIEDSKSFIKENVSYSIFSIPVASTFTPSKGKVQGLKKAPKERLYDNYVSAGFGNYTSPLFSAFLHSGDERYNDYGVFLNYFSSDGGVGDKQLNTNYLNAKIDLYYKQLNKDYNWRINGGYKRNQVNYYGLPSEIIFDDNLISSIDEEQAYNLFYLAGNLNFESYFVKGASAEFYNFSDSFKSSETRFLLKPKFEFPISNELINADFSIDYLTGKFEKNYLTDYIIDYSFVNLGFNPNFKILRKNLVINLGAKLYYAFDLENDKSEFFAYPNVTASFKVVEDVFILTAGVTGDLIQNTYRDFTDKNPYISPTLSISQTDKQYKAFVGAKGKLSSDVAYNFNVSYQNEINKPFFIQNQTLTDGTISVENSYQLGNSFGVAYDNLKTINVFGEIEFQISKELNLVGSVNYNNYSVDEQLEAWNLPDIKATISADYKFEKWFVGGDLFFRGTTKDFVIPYGDIFENGLIVKNNSFVDLNFNFGYNFTNQLSAFAKINNVLGKYDRFVNYPVQSIQFLAGITYKFDL